MQEQLNAYKALYETAKQHRDFISDQHFQPLEEKVQELELSVMFNMKLEYAGFKHYAVPNSYDSWSRILYFGEGLDRKVSFSDNGTQPKNEWLYVVRFAAGPYIFGEYFKDQYPQETFRLFFNELKTFEPKYCDTRNNELYFTKETAHKVHAAFWEIFKKYKDMCQQEYERNRVKELEAELAKLKGN